MITIPTLAAQNQRDLFIQANEYYKHGNIDRAYECYQQITPKNAVVHFNLGNCAYRLGKYGMALVHWHRAEWDWGMWDRETVHKNIKFVQQKLTPVAQAHEPTLLQALMSFIVAPLQSLVSLAKAIPLLYLQLWILLLWGLFLLMGVFLPRLPILKSICLGSSLLVLSLVGLRLWAQHHHQVIVTKAPAALTSGPEFKGFTVLGQLPEGTEADIIGESGVFYKVRFNGTTGWVAQQNVEKI
jgi:hypothetical protein